MSDGQLEVFGIFADDLDILLEIYNEFKETHITYFENIEKAINTKNAKDLELHAHTLKGVMRNFYYDEAVTYLQELEKNARESNFEGADELFENSKINVMEFFSRFESALSSKAA